MVPGDEIKYLSTLPQPANTNQNVPSASAASRCPIMAPSNSCVPARTMRKRCINVRVTLERNRGGICCAHGLLFDNMLSCSQLSSWNRWSRMSP
jgi:hypothetical protein